MVKKRLIGVITVLNGWAVQSIGYQTRLPLGRPEILAENLDRWGADEILIQDIGRSRSAKGPDLDLLLKIASKGLSTPLCFAGGIRNEEDASQVIKHGAERVVLDAILTTSPDEVRKIAGHIGAQAVIASVPVGLEDGELHWYNYLTKQKQTVDKFGDHSQSGCVSEVLLIDYLNEGKFEGFQMDLVEEWPFEAQPLIVFGGISSPHLQQSLFEHAKVAAVGVGNFLNYKEHALQGIKDVLESQRLRPSIYSETLDKEMPHV
jgi:imidazole glycerol-phosphate synthase subunit HisF